MNVWKKFSFFNFFRKEKVELPPEIVQETEEVPKKLKKAIVVDGSISELVDVVSELETTEDIVIFPSIVIEELNNYEGVGYKKHLITRLLNLAGLEKNLVFSETNRTLEGWSTSGWQDNLIVNTAISFCNEYDVTLYTCDKELSFKCKSKGVNARYFQKNQNNLGKNTSKKNLPSNIYENNLVLEENTAYFEKIELLSSYETVIFKKHKKFFMLPDSTVFPRYFLSRGSILLGPQDYTFISLGDTLYKVDFNSISKCRVKSMVGKSNLHLEKRGILKRDISLKNLPNYISDLK